MKRRLISVSLTVLLIICALAACGEASAPAQGTSAPSADAPASGGDAAAAETTAELNESEFDPLPERDMGGFKLRFYNYDDSWLTWAIMTMDADSENGDNVNDAIYRRNRRVEDKYNCEISETLVKNTNDDIKKIVMSGDDLYEIMFVYDELCASDYCAGLITTWDRMTYVDSSHSWWSQNAIDVFSLKGKQFAAVGDLSLGMATRGFVLLFNKELYKSIDGAPDLYDAVRDSSWTIDTFASVCKDFARDLNGDGVMDDKDMWPTTGAVKLHFGSLVTGAGVKYIDLNSDGDPYFAIPGNEYAMNVFEKIFKVHDGTNIYYSLVGDVHNGSNESRVIFKEGRQLFQGTSTKAIETYRDCDFDIGIIPYPKYETSQESYHVLTSGTGVLTIPATLPDDRFENVSILIDALARDSHYDLLPTYREVVLKTKYSRDEDSAEMLDIIFNAGTFDLGLSIWPDVTYYKYMESYLKMKDDFASLTEKQASAVQGKIDKLLEALAESEG
ncbi:MAG: hypothetical protein K6D94_09365 [Clostridiales bacterium]|nr:hypothetical protein [Clostridiales bacterium]